MSLRTPLGKVRGLGAAREGSGHWWAQRLTALALAPLSLVFVALVMMFRGAGHAEAVTLIRNPLAAIALLLFIVAGFHHLKLGLQVVIEDYVHHECVKIISLAALTMASIALAVACIFAVLKIALGS
ncbi:MAG: succinate dehydrogenase, hydrophobic membrane anchor protein [Alphaproteobacteria bacterium]